MNTANPVMRFAEIAMPDSSVAIVEWSDSKKFSVHFEDGVHPDGDDKKRFSRLSRVLVYLADVALQMEREEV